MHGRLIYTSLSILFSGCIALVMLSIGGTVRDQLDIGSNHTLSSAVFDVPAQEWPAVDISTDAGLDTLLDALVETLKIGIGEPLAIGQLPTKGAVGYRGLITLSADDVPDHPLHGDLRLRMLAGRNIAIFGGNNLSTFFWRNPATQDLTDLEFSGITGQFRFNGGLREGDASDRAIFQLPMKGEIWLPEEISGEAEKSYEAEGVAIGALTQTGIIGDVILTVTDDAGRSIAFSGGLLAVIDEVTDKF